MKHAILFTLVTLGATAFSAERSVTCGDHWLEISASWKDGQTKASVEFSGDSQPDRSNVTSTVLRSGKTIVVTFQDAIGGQLRIDEKGEGYVKESKKGSETAIAPCYVK